MLRQTAGVEVKNVARFRHDCLPQNLPAESLDDFRWLVGEVCSLVQAE